MNFRKEIHIMTTEFDNSVVPSIPEDLDPGYTNAEELSWLDKMIAKFMVKIAKFLLKFGIKLAF